MRYLAIALLLLSPAATLAQVERTEFAAPIRLSEMDLPHAAPVMADVNRDGQQELIVGLYSQDPFTQARARVFTNLGFRGQALGDAWGIGQPDWLMAAGQPACVDEFCHTGFGPQFVDFDGDGNLDLVSGTRDCRLCIFPGDENGRFSALQEFVYADKEHQRTLRYNCRLKLTDWDHDGDVDLLAVVRKGIWWIPVETAAFPPQFRAPIQICEMDLAHEAFSSCEVADWNDDGRDDLVVSYWDGSVWVMHGEVHESNDEPMDRSPKLGDPIQILNASGPRMIDADAEGNFERPESPHGHVRICVTDFDGDGLLDLVIGDAWMSVRPVVKRVPVSPQQEALDEMNRVRESELRERLNKLQSAGSEPDGPNAAPSDTEKLQLLREQCGLIWRINHTEKSRMQRHGSVWFLRRIE